MPREQLISSKDVCCTACFTGTSPPFIHHVRRLAPSFQPRGLTGVRPGRTNNCLLLTKTAPVKVLLFVGNRRLPIFKRNGKLLQHAADLLFQFSMAVPRRHRRAFLAQPASLELRLPLTPTGGGRLLTQFAIVDLLPAGRNSLLLTEPPFRFIRHRRRSTSALPAKRLD